MNSRALGRLLSLAYVLGIISGYSWGNINGRLGYHLTRSDLTAKRPYVLGKPREWWRCLLVRHHLRGDEVGFGLCAKCVPWPCCGARTYAHHSECKERDA